jgi:DNA repair exonuclease SbcCD ATPase subunit
VKKLISVILSVCLITGVVSQSQAALVLDDAEKEALLALHSLNPVKYVARLMVWRNISLPSMYPALKEAEGWIRKEVSRGKDFFSVLVETYHDEPTYITKTNKDFFFKYVESNTTEAVALEIFRFGISAARLADAMQEERKQVPALAAYPQSTLLLADAEKEALLERLKHNPVEFTARLMVWRNISLPSMYPALKEAEGRIRKEVSSGDDFFSVLVETYHDSPTYITKRSKVGYFEWLVSNPTEAVADEILHYGISAALLADAMQEERKQVEEHRKAAQEAESRAQQAADRAALERQKREEAAENARAKAAREQRAAQEEQRKALAEAQRQQRKMQKKAEQRKVLEEAQRKAQEAESRAAEAEIRAAEAAEECKKQRNEQQQQKQQHKQKKRKDDHTICMYVL